MGVNLIVGYAGQETLAQAAFVGIGAYTHRASRPRPGMPFGVALRRLRPARLRHRHRARLPGAARAEALPRLRDARLLGARAGWSSATRQWLTGGVIGHSRHRAAVAVRPVSCAATLHFYWFVLAIAALLTFVHVVDRALARGVAPSRRCARTRCAPRASASTCARYTLLAFAHRLGLRRHGRQPLCAAGRVHRPQRRSRSAPRCSSC